VYHNTYIKRLLPARRKRKQCGPDATRSRDAPCVVRARRQPAPRCRKRRTQPSGLRRKSRACGATRPDTCISMHYLHMHSKEESKQEDGSGCLLHDAACRIRSTLKHELSLAASTDNHSTSRRSAQSTAGYIYQRITNRSDTRKPRRQNATPCAAEIRHDRRRRLAAVVAVVLVVAHGVSADSLSIYIVGSFSPAHLQYRPRTGGGRRSRRGGQLPRAKGRSNHTASAPPVLHLLLRFLPADRTLACRTAPAHAREWGSSTAWRHEMPESLPLSPWCPAPAAKRTRGEPRPRPSGSLARSPIPNPRRRASGGFSSRVDLAGAI